MHTETGADYFNTQSDKEEKTGKYFIDPLGKKRATETGPVTDRINKFRNEILAPIRYIYGDKNQTLFLEVDGTKKQIRYTNQSIPDSYKGKK